MYIHICMHIYIYIYVYTYICTHMCISIYIYIYIWFTPKLGFPLLLARCGLGAAIYTYTHRINICIYTRNIYIYVYRQHIHIHNYTNANSAMRAGMRGTIFIPLILSLLRLLDSNCSGDSLWAWAFQPLNLRFCLSQAL